MAPSCGIGGPVWLPMPQQGFRAFDADRPRIWFRQSGQASSPWQPCGRIQKEQRSDGFNCRYLFTTTVRPNTDEPPFSWRDSRVPFLLSFTRTPAIGRGAGYRRRSFGLLVVTIFAGIAGTGSSPIPAAPPSPRKFFDSLLGRPAEPEPAFIAAPTPPGPEEVKTLERLATVPKPTVPQPTESKPTVSKPTESKPTASKPTASKPTASKPTASKPTVSPHDGSASGPSVPAGTLPRSVPAAVIAKPAPPAKPPTWHETVAFANALQASAQKVAAAAVDPSFKPNPTNPAPTAARSTTSTAASGKAAVPVQRGSDAGRSGQAASAPPSPPGIAAPVTQRFTKLRQRIAQTLAAYQRRPLNTNQHTPWEVMHGFIAFGIPTKIRVGGPAGDPVNAIGWVNTGGRCRGQVMLAGAGDRLTALRGIGVQGHSAQYLAVLAQCRVAMNSPITIQSKAFTVADLVKEEKLACKSGTELTFALISLAHYLPTDSTWSTRDGKPWSLERLMAEEIEQPIRGAPCGGTHRLFGLSYGCQRRLRATGQLDGVYLRADKFVRDYQQFTLTKLQNRDGSFSTEWFKYPADREDDIDRKIQTTGHILEWLVASLDQEALFQPRVTAAVEFLTAALASEPSREWKLGPLGHALHSLTIYQERAWGTVLPGGIAAFNGSMRPVADVQMAERSPARATKNGGEPKPTLRR